MKKISKEEKAITLISLVITIVVLLILSSIVTYSGIDVIKSSKFTAFSTELKIMQTQVNNIYQKYKDNNTIIIDETTYYGEAQKNNTEGKKIILELGEEILGDKETQANKVFTESESGIISQEGYRYWSNELINKLGIEGVKGEFFVNIEKRSIVSYEGFEYEGKNYYTITQLPDGLYNVEYEDANTGKPTFNISYEDIGNNKWRVTISNIEYEHYINKWEVKYQLEGENSWNTTENTSFVINGLGGHKIKLINGNVESEEKKINIVNKPLLKDGMQAITFASDGAETVVTDTSKNDWYNYETQEGRTDTYNEETGEYGTSHWANAKLNDNYYVWIPRYAYKIYDTEGEEGYEKYTSQSGNSYRIDVKFIEKNVTSENIETEVGEGYIVHPAFTFDNKELSGIWVGKYESSNDGEGNVEIVPNATSYTGIDVATMFTKAQALSTENNDAHMLKNIEWGAVAYLAQSQYGRNGTEISVNQCENKITGAGRGIGAEVDYPIYNSTYTVDATTNLLSAEQQYNGKIGKLSSTTGNTYGVYDMAGGAFEYVMGFYGTAENTPTLGNTAFSDIPERKYYDLYINKTSVDISNIGDALYETKSWNSDGAVFVHESFPVFLRGGICTSTSNVGTFYFNIGDGNESNNASFRVCLAVNE